MAPEWSRLWQRFPNRSRSNL